MPKVGDIKYCRIEHDNTGGDGASSSWYIEHIEVSEAKSSSGADTAAATFFWFNDWVQMPPEDQDGDGKPDKDRVPKLEAQATLCADAASALAELKKSGGLSHDQMQMQSRAYNALEWRILNICNDEKQTKKLWKQLCSNNESGKSNHCPLTEFWSMLTDDFPLLSSMSARMRAFNRSLELQNRETDSKKEHDTKVGKHTFRLLLLNTMLYCRIYSIVDRDDDGHQDVDLSRENLKKKVHFLGLTYADDEWDKEYEAMQAKSQAGTGVVGEVVLDVFCAWYADLKVTQPILEEAQNAGDKLRRKAERRQKKLEEHEAKEKAEKIAAENKARIEGGGGEAAEGAAPANESVLTFAALDFDTTDLAALEAHLRSELKKRDVADADTIAIKLTKGSVIAAVAAGSKDDKDKIDQAADDIINAVLALVGNVTDVYVPPADDAKGKGKGDGEAAEGAAPEPPKAEELPDDDATPAAAGEAAGEVDPNQPALDRIAAVAVSHPGNAMASEFGLDYYKTLPAEERGELLACCLPGTENPTSAAGCFAISPDAYDKFEPFFNKVVTKLHAAPKLPAAAEDGGNAAADSASAAKAVVASVRVDAIRNVSGFPLSPSMTTEDRSGLESKLVAAFQTLQSNDDYGGRYYALTPGHAEYVDEAGWGSMVDAGGDLARPEDPSSNKEFVSAGIAREFPHGRGCYMSDDGEVVIWVGQEDHVRISCVTTGHDFKDMDVRLKTTLALLEAVPGLSFLDSPAYNHVTVDPRYVGSGVVKAASISDAAIEALELAGGGGVGKAMDACRAAGLEATKSPLDGKVRVASRLRFAAGAVARGREVFDPAAEKQAMAAMAHGLQAFYVAPKKAKRASKKEDAPKPEVAAAAATPEPPKPKTPPKPETPPAPTPEAKRTGPRSFGELETEVQELCSDKAKVAALQRTMVLGPGKPATLADVNKKLAEYDALLGSEAALRRSFLACIDPDAGANPVVEKSDFGTLVVMTLYFTKAFGFMKEAQVDPEKRLDLAAFKGMLDQFKLATTNPRNPFEVDPVEITSEFDAMESNDGGSIAFDDFVVWYTARRCPFVFDQEPEQTLMPNITISASTDDLMK